MTDATQHRAADTNSGRGRNDEITRHKSASDAEHGMKSQGRKAEAGRKVSPAQSQRRR